MRGLHLLVLLGAVFGVRGKIFQRCELANELLRLGADRPHLSTWLCIAERESGLNSSAVGNLNADGSSDHGLFQISDRYWCSPQGWACNLPCSLLEDDQIADDWRCVRRIHKQHGHLSGNGFRAWAVYEPHCSGDTSAYLEGCDLEHDSTTSTTTTTTTTEGPDEGESVERLSAREGNNAAKIQVLDLEMMEKRQDAKSLKTSSGRRWKAWTFKRSFPVFENTY